MVLPCLLLLAALSACGGRPGNGAAEPGARAPVLLDEGHTGANNVAVRVTSIRERRFLTTVRQQADFSCGSAAIATLLTYHYAMPTRETEVFERMMADGDQERIRRQGFSFLDMQRFLAGRGLQSNGYRMPLARFEQVRVPAIALIDENGYRHFVVLRGIDAGRVLLADPNLGTRTMRRDRFERIWNGVLFFVTDRPAFAQATFGAPEDWEVRPRAPVTEIRNLMDNLRSGQGLPDRRFF
jgi:hypothetical protein